MEAAERRSLRCVWVTGGRALTEQEAAIEIVSEARRLLQEDLAQLGVQWDPTTLPPGASTVSNLDDHHSSESDNSSVSFISPQQLKADDSKEGDRHGLKKSESRDIDRHREEIKEDYKPDKRMTLEKIRESKGEARRGQPEETQVNKGLGKQNNKDRTETEVGQTGNRAPVERGHVTKKEETNRNLSKANATENPDEVRESQKHTKSEQEVEECKKSEEKGGQKSEGTVLVKAGGQQAKRCIPERSLTQELAEIVSSPPQLLPHPQPSPSPMPPPRFRAPISRVEEQNVPTRTSKGDGTTECAASPLQTGRQKHSRALSKVLHSIQTEKSLQDNVETAQTSRLASAYNSAPAAQVPATVQACDPGPQTPLTPSAPTNDSPLSSSPASVPLFSPEAKRRRIEGTEIDKFSSPELYVGEERDEDVEGNVKKEEESFGDSFELDTQTERIILQQTCQNENGNDKSMNQLEEIEQIREEEMVETGMETEEGNNRLETPDNACPRFNISLTDSQMEIILNTSHQVTKQNYHSLCMECKNKIQYKKMTFLFIKDMLLFSQISPGPGEDKNEDSGNDNEAPEANPVASESINRSSSFLFDSLYDSSLLAGLSPHQVPDQSDEEESAGQDVQDKRPLSSTQEQRRSELLANQEAEKQEAIEWGESLFNLSEWGDSLLVGEHFLERQSFLRHTERTQKEQNHVLPEQHLSNLQSEPSQIQPQPDCVAAQIECDNARTKNNPGRTHKIKQFITGQNDSKPGARQGRINRDGENREQVEKESKGGKINVLLSDNVPESTRHCSPGLQEIFDCWPSMSDQSWQNPPTCHTDTETLTHKHAANTVKAPDLHQPTIHVGRKRGKIKVQSAAAESDSHLLDPSKHDAENVTERPGSAGDLIPPTQETPPVTPRVKLTTSSVQSPLTAQPLNQSTPSALCPRKPAAPKCPESRTGHGNNPPKAVSDNKQLTSTFDHHHKCQALRTQPQPELTSVPHPTSETEPVLHTDPDLSPPRDCASPSIPCPKLPSDTESPVDEGFSLQLSQDASLCSSNTGTFSIIDVASDRCLFGTFIKEWKTKERYSLALAYEHREQRQQPQDEIGGKHKRGNHQSDINQE